MNDTTHTLPSGSGLYVTFPLYGTIPLGALSPNEQEDYIDAIKNPSDTIDAYCVECKSNSTFTGREVRTAVAINEECEWIDKELFGVEFVCARDYKHRIYAFFHL